MDLVDEEHVTLAEIGEDAHEIGAAIERGPGGGDQGRAHLVGHDGGERGLAEPGRPRQEHVVEWLSPATGRLHRDAQALDGGALPHVLVQPLGPKLALELDLLGEGRLAHHVRLVRHRLSPPRAPTAGAPAPR